MITEHYVVLGVARPRAKWLADVGSWATSSTLPIEFIRCVSVDEARARLRSDRRYSALLVDEMCTNLDRDVLEAARKAHCVPIIVSDSPGRRDWTRLGAACVLAEPLTPDTLFSALQEHALGIERRQITELRPSLQSDFASTETNGRLVTVIGSGGTGTSSVAMALAAHFASAQRARKARAGLVALIDGSLNADQALLHDLGDVVPGLQELVDLHRSDQPTPQETRDHLWSIPTRGYDLLPGLRRHRDWSSIRRRATLAALRSLRHSYEFLVADADCDLEGESDTGSIDIEDRNLLSRELVTNADIIVVTSRPGVVGLNRLLRLLTTLDEQQVDLKRILPVVIAAPRSRTERSVLTRTMSTLFSEIRPTSQTPTTVMVPLRRDLEPFLREGAPLPASSFGSITSALDSMLARNSPLPVGDALPVAITPGHLGRTA